MKKDPVTIVTASEWRAMNENCRDFYFFVISIPSLKKARSISERLRQSVARIEMIRYKLRWYDVFLREGGVVNTISI